MSREIFCRTWGFYNRWCNQHISDPW